MVKQQIWLPSYFSSGMVLQQQVSLPLRGRCQPTTSLRVDMVRAPFDGRAVSPLDSQYGTVFATETVSGEDGAFVLYLPACEASLDPYTLRLSVGSETLVLRDILFGEVWLCAGQADLQAPLEARPGAGSGDMIANWPYVRVFSQAADGLAKNQPTYAYTPLADVVAGQWLSDDQPEPLAKVSAIGWYFARDLHQELRCPVAIIETAQRDTLLHTWLSRPVLESHSHLCDHVIKLGQYRDAGSWNLAGELNFNQPSALYNHKIAPLAGLGLRGILWSHGDQECQYPGYYREGLLSLAADWRSLFHAPHAKLPAFLMIGLAPRYFGQPDFYQQAILNETLVVVRHQMPSPAALVPIHDLMPAASGTAGHGGQTLATTIRPAIASRLKTVSLGLLYQRKAPHTSPECTSIELVGNKMMLTFADTGDGLRLTGEDVRVRGFAICGPDRVYQEAHAKILFGVRVLVWHDQIDEPCGVTYGFYDLNHRANLISRDHLPVVPFRSDQEPSRYALPQEWIHCDGLEDWYYPQPAAGSTDQRLRPVRQPIWQVRQGQVTFQLEKTNKTEGEAALLLHYQTDEAGYISFGPNLADPACFPPLDLSPFVSLTMDVFNSEQQTKYLSLQLRSDSLPALSGSGEPAAAPAAPTPAAAAPDPAALRTATTRRQPALPALRWQTLTFSLAELSLNLTAIRTLTWLLDDRKGRGTLYIDNIRLNRPN